MTTATTPSLDVLHTVPELLSFHYEHNPTRPMFVFAASESQQNATEISFLEFVRACHRFAHIVRPRRAGPERAVVAVVALADTLVYETIIAGTMHSGLVPLLISPRNSAVAVVNLLRKSGAHRLLTTHTTLKDLINGIKNELSSSEESFDITFEEVPGFIELYPKLGTETDADPFQPYPSCPVRPDPNGTAMILHSSGSTGLPKAIPQNHHSVQSWAGFSSGTELRDYDVPLRLGSMALPPFHGYAFYAQLACALFNSLTVSLYPPVVSKPDMQPIIPTPENILSHSQRTKCNCLITVPSMLQAWSHSSTDINILRSMEVVIFAGGPLPPAIGDHLVSEGVHIRSLYGGTEFAIPTAVNASADREDWQWHKFSEKTRTKWAPQGDGTYECQFLAAETHPLAYVNMSNPRGYATSDLFVEHPTKPGLWKVVGRIDDVLVHTSGEKTVPAPIENVLLRSPLILGAIMFGRERDQPGVLIEPTPGNEINVRNLEELSSYRNKIWPIVEEANQIAPAFSRIYKEMILVTSPEKPLARAPKGTVMRKAAIRDYEHEINQIANIVSVSRYATVESNANSSPTSPPAEWDSAHLVQWLTDQVKDLTGSVLTPTMDMFENGLDSLSATILRLRIFSALRSSETSLIQAASKLMTQNTVYNHPSIQDLSTHILGIVNPEDPIQSETSAKKIEKDEHMRQMEEMIAKYSKGLEVIVNGNSHDTVPRSNVILLTGSTGSLGAQILASLLKNSSVHRIYALNRPSSVHTSLLNRHKERFLDRGLDTSFLDAKKVVYLQGESALPQLGLSQEVYEALRGEITIIIHNAWRLDFNLSLSSFESQVRGVRSLVDLARSSRHRSSLRFLFTSSISAAQGWDASKKGPYPEEILMDAGGAVGMGYGEGKYVSERILARSGLLTTSFRIGQISGGKPNGAWAMSDWFPMMIKSSIKLNMLPDAHGVISWLPTDAVADAIIDVGLFKQNPPSAINLIHPRPVSWSNMIQVVRKAVIQLKSPDSEALPLVPIDTWVDALERMAESAAEGLEDELPAGKIIDFYRKMAEADKQIEGRDDVEAVGLTPLATDHIKSISPSIRDLPPICGSDAERWVAYWVQSGL
ncbi:hypothetical protein GYMLUDRAFT_241246 [Collybiopsis luxurians FD-317 M1]|uniref:L-aminoadipate-semialdehyde dehydrogenase n=1 Tax=Collybiopsis luxurians FD-317 M1 TaxID=944289 RepID=A0A0D0BIV3_9AGAR|nr:hypothetical protein GYMLUDRAFT_241246 [Collybiopsis luxurians FD-317 M1]